MDKLAHAETLLSLVEFECSGDMRTKTRSLDFNTTFENVVSWYAEAMELLSQHSRTELRLLDDVGL